MEVVINLLIVIGAFISMEAVAWLTHKYVMHGFLWYLHRDHHQKEPGFFEKISLKVENVPVFEKNILKVEKSKRPGFCQSHLRALF